MHQGYTIHLHRLALRINFRSQFCHDLVIDFDATFKNQLLALPSTRNARCSEYLLQSLLRLSHRHGRGAARTLRTTRFFLSLLLVHFPGSIL